MPPDVPPWTTTVQGANHAILEVVYDHTDRGSLEDITDLNRLLQCRYIPTYLGSHFISESTRGTEMALTPCQYLRGKSRREGGMDSK